MKWFGTGLMLATVGASLFILREAYSGKAKADVSESEQELNELVVEMQELLHEARYQELVGSLM
jgi:hypothetical protein